MTIAPLSDETARTIQSTLVLNDATSVIKELIDNGLDSRATSVTIEISSNTLDIIQVKDNGTGIAVEDRQLLCRRGCTSKIRNLADLETLGGSYLGFRGEALASVAELSEAVGITTRVSHETVGTVLNLGQGGKLLSSASASHPVGTTVRVQNFLLPIPVRKQTALKAATKTLAEIKKLLTHYAFARPAVRYTLRVLKGKNDKANWSYAPCVDGEGLDIAGAKIVGKDVASLCVMHAASLFGDAHDEYRAEALIVKPSDQDLSQVSNVGQYISVDGRPLIADRGFCRDLVKLYKKYLRHAISAGSKVPSKPFWALQILCPDGSYDVNVEPAKNEVLFHSRELVIKLVSKLLIEYYGDDEQQECIVSDKKHLAADVGQSSAFNILLARTQDEARLSKGTSANVSDHPTESSPITHPRDTLEALGPIHASYDPAAISNSPKQVLFRNMYAVDNDFENDEEGTTVPVGLPISSTVEADNEEISDTNAWIRNPFTTAAMHTRLPPQKGGYGRDQSPSRRGERPSMRMQPRNTSSVGASSPASNDVRHAYRSTLNPFPSLPTPSQSPMHSNPYQNPGPPALWRRRRDLYEDENAAEETSTNDSSTARQQELLRDCFAPTRSSKLGTASVTPEKDPDASAAVTDRNRAVSDDTYVVLSPDIPQPGGQSRPFRSHFKMTRTSEPPATTARKTVSLLNSDKSSRNSSELDDIMVFELRKKALSNRHKGVRTRLDPAELAATQRDLIVDSFGEAEVPGSVLTQSSGLKDHTPVDYEARFQHDQPSLVTPKSNPHRNRYEAAIRGLGDGQDEFVSSAAAPVDQTSYDSPSTFVAAEAGMDKIPPSDPRGYLIKHQQGRDLRAATKTSSNLQVTKVKSSRLPLESIPTNAINHNLICAPFDEGHSSISTLMNKVARLKQFDQYAARGKNKYTTFLPSSPETKLWEARLEVMIRTNYAAIEGGSVSQPSRKVSIQRGGQDSGTPLRSEARHLMPATKLNLATFLKAHASMLEEELPTLPTRETQKEKLDKT